MIESCQYTSNMSYSRSMMPQVAVGVGILGGLHLLKNDIEHEKIGENLKDWHI
jgi:hypothetical protein